MERADAPPLEPPAAPPAPATPHWGLVGTLLWSVLLGLVAVVVSSAVAVAFVSAAGKVPADQMQQALKAAQADGTLLAWASIAMTLAAIPLVILAIKFKKGSRVADYLALQPVAPSILLKWIGILLVAIVLVDGFTHAIGRPVVPEFMRLAHASAQPIWLLWIALVVTAPLLEEVLFRGFVFRGLAASFVGPSATIVLTAVVWAVIHTQYDLYSMSIIVLLGILFGVARWRTGSLLVPITLHAVTNAVAAAQAAFL